MRLNIKVDETTIKWALSKRNNGNERGYRILIDEVAQDLKYKYKASDVEIYGLINDAINKILKGAC